MSHTIYYNAVLESNDVTFSGELKEEEWGSFIQIIQFIALSSITSFRSEEVANVSIRTPHIKYHTTGSLKNLWIEALSKIEEKGIVISGLQDEVPLNLLPLNESSITSLNLEFVNLTQAGVFEFLKSNKKLTSLKVVNAILEREGFKDLFTALRENRDLKYLTIENLMIDSAQMKWIAFHLPAISVRSLSVLGIVGKTEGWPQALGYGLASNIILEKLVLKACGVPGRTPSLTDVEIESMEKPLKENNFTLQSFSLNRFQGISFRFINGETHKRYRNHPSELEGEKKWFALIGEEDRVRVWDGGNKEEFEEWLSHVIEKQIKITSLYIHHSDLF